MKRIIAICTMIAITLCLFSGCTSKNHINQKKEANLILDELIVALEADDTATIKSIFAVEVQNSLNEELDIQIEEMVEYFDGDLVSYDKIRTVCHHHIRDLIQRFTTNFNAVHFKNFIINRQ